MANLAIERKAAKKAANMKAAAERFVRLQAAQKYQKEKLARLASNRTALLSRADSHAGFGTWLQMNGYRRTAGYAARFLARVQAPARSE